MIEKGNGDAKLQTVLLNLEFKLSTGLPHTRLSPRAGIRLVKILTPGAQGLKADWVSRPLSVQSLKSVLAARHMTIVPLVREHH